MGFNLKGRSFLSLTDYTPQEIDFLLTLSITLKKNKYAGIRTRTLEGKNLAFIFEKPSTRTHCAFAVAAADEGAHGEYLLGTDLHLGVDETVKDTARVLGRMFDGIEFRGFKNETCEQLAQYSGVPVWNGLTDKFHPTQILADFLTILEHKGRLRGIKFAYCGDGRSNMANSLMIGAAKMGMDFRISSHESLFPDKELLDHARQYAHLRGAEITLTADPAEGVAEADVIYTDVWASMGEEDKIEERIKLLHPYQVNQALIDLTGNPDVIFMHCLPCNHTHETRITQQYPDVCEATDEVFEGRHSVVFDEAENRLHTIKAVMVATL